MSDIVERLRAWADADPNAMLEGAEPDISAAADEIDRLRTALAAETERTRVLTEALKCAMDEDAAVWYPVACEAIRASAPSPAQEQT